MRDNGERASLADFRARHQSIAKVLADRTDGLEFVQDAAASLVETKSVDGAIEDVIPMARLGEYRITREVGRGGMGVVYEAEQVPLDCRVALKVLPTTASRDSRQRRRFQVEDRAAALLHHEHIAPVFGIGCDQGVHYYAMQFIEGRSLTDLSSKPSPCRSPRHSLWTHDLGRYPMNARNVRRILCAVPLFSSAPRLGNEGRSSYDRFLIGARSRKPAISGSGLSDDARPYPELVAHAPRATTIRIDVKMGKRH
jgi:hypothetical protein